MPWFVDVIIKPKEAVSAKQMEEIIQMLRVLMIPQVVLGISVYLSTLLNIYERFLVPQLAPLFYNLGRIAALYVLIPILGQSPWVLVWGTVLGAVAHLLIQLPVVKHLSIKYLPVIDLKDYYVHHLATVAAPRVVAISVEQIGVTVDKFIAFGLVNSALALYNLAIQVVSVPLSLIGSAFATATYPALSKAFNSNDRILASQIFIRIVNQILFFAIPSAILLLVMRVPIARLAYGIFGNQIGFTQTYTIAWVILFFAPGIVFESLRTFIYRTFYAAHDTVRPLIMAIVVLIAGAATGILFSNYLSHFDTFAIQDITFNLSYFWTKESGVAAVGGLALSSTVVFTIEAFIMIYWLNKKYFQAPFADFWKPILRKLIAGFFMLICSYFIYKIWGGLESTEKTIYLLILTITTTASALMVYLGVSWLLRIEEVKVYIKFLSKYPNLNLIKKFRNFDPIPNEVDY
jgi:peptidoglycan biosynthesis protein MviN/MurJ (putative lipid II flippase)